MEYLDLILLAILGATAALLAVLVWRKERRTQMSAAAPFLPGATVLLPAAQPIAASTPSQRGRKENDLPNVETPANCAAAAPAQAPIPRVLEMLKEKDALTAAFVLSEILAPPVATRARRP